MSQFRIEKRRAQAELTFATGATLRGSFFLSSATPMQVGPERVADLLNAGTGFFPFDPAGDSRQGTILVNRAHVVAVRLLEPVAEAQIDPGYALATERRVVMTLASGMRLEGTIRVYCPQGRDRLSDWTRTADAFWYLETGDTTFIVNAAHVVEVRETEQVDLGGRVLQLARVGQAAPMGDDNA